MSADNTFAIAYKYHALGRCVIPSGGGAGGKSALVRWKEYQTTAPTDEDIERWNSELKLEIWALVTTGGFMGTCRVAVLQLLPGVGQGELTQYEEG